MKIHSPGRINIIGEHVDYTGGLVMPASIDKGITFDVSDRPGNVLELHATDLGEQHLLPLPVTGRTDKLWVDYLAGIVNEFQLLGHEVPGLKISFGGDIPRGSGMSSSAALEGGMAFLLNEKLGAGLSRPELAQLCKRSSNNFLGIPSGIMDQFASLNGSKDGPILLNCDTLKFEPIEADLPGYTWMLVNSMVTHSLDGGEYHVRVRECQQALKALRSNYPELLNLSDATEPQLTAISSHVPENVLRRARYVVGENQRVQHMVKALEDGDVRRAGQLLNITHRGLRDDYEVSCPEVDFLQQLATDDLVDMIAGSRMMGGGFGGCTINLVKEDQVEAIRREITEAYQAEYGITPEFYPVTIGPATRIV